MKVHIAVDNERGLILFVQTTDANVHDVIPAADLLCGEESVVYADAICQGIEKREETQDRGIGFGVAIRHGKRRVLSDTPDGRLNHQFQAIRCLGPSFRYCYLDTHWSWMARLFYSLLRLRRVAC